MGEANRPIPITLTGNDTPLLIPLGLTSAKPALRHLYAMCEEKLPRKRQRPSPP